MSSASPYNEEERRPMWKRLARKMKLHESSPRGAVLLTVGLLLTAAGLTILLRAAQIQDFVLKTAMALHEGSASHEGWSKTPRIRVDMYFFNWTNPEQLGEEGMKPKFQEVGPFRFWQVREKVNVTWNENGTVTFKNLLRYFEDEDSPVDLDVNITTLNVVAYSLAYSYRYAGYFTQRSLSMTLSLLSDVAVTKTARELIFDGYEDKILNIATLFPFVDAMDKFGFFYNRNDTAENDGIINMWKDIDEDFGKMKSWNYKNHTGYFQDHCGDVGGSSGEFFPMHPKRSYLEVFNPELCRKVKLYYEEDVEIKELEAFRFTGTDMFDNGTLYPENSCYCNDGCPPTGVFNVSVCRQGSPFFLSLPHFYGADPYYLDLVEGLQPQKDKHDFFFTLEQETGVIVDVAGRLQVNVHLKSIPHITFYDSIPEVFFPIFYYEQSNSISDENAQRMRPIKYLALIVNIVSVVFILLGFVILLFPILRLRLTKNDVDTKENTQETLLKR